MGSGKLINRIVKLAAIVAVAGSLVSCNTQPAPSPIDSDVPTAFRPTLRTDAGIEPRLWAVRLRIFSIEVPVGMSSRSEQIWSYLDEEPIQAGRLGVLAANGFRVGTASRQAWPQLANILSEMTGQQLNEIILTVPPGKIIPVTLKQNQPSQTIFIYSQDRTVEGQDYPPGDNLLAIAVTVNRDDPSMVILTATPQIRSSQSKVKIRKSSKGGFTKKRQSSIIPFRQLTFQATLPSKDVIIIGPGSESSRTTSLAYNFLISPRKGVEFERLLVLVPETWTPANQKARAAGSGGNAD